MNGLTINKGALIPLREAEAWKNLHAVKVSNGTLEIYSVFTWPDGSLQVGFPTCKLNAEELSSLLALLHAG